MGLVYYVIDIESSGLKASWHEITEVSIIRVSDRHQFSDFVRPEHPERADQRALDATGRTRKDLYKGIPQVKAVEVFTEFLERDGLTPDHRVMIAHAGAFDRRFVHFLWGSFNKVFPANFWIDTKYCAKEYITKQLGIEKPKLTLGASLDHCSLKVRGTLHSAVADTQNTYMLYTHLVKNGLDHLHLLSDIHMKKPYLMQKLLMNSGHKHN